jgi:hypothetical protein
MQEREIVQSAIEHLHQLTGIEVREVPAPVVKRKQNLQPDTAIELKTGEKRYTFCVQVKNELRQLHLVHLIDSLGHDAENWMLICQYLSKNNRALLKKENINYLDASGNSHIRQGALFLFINDQRQANTSKVWRPSGLRFIFAILLNPELLNEPYRHIASKSNLALGTVGALFQELIKEKFFTNYNSRYRIENREALLNRWTETYHAVLRPKLVQGRFRFATSKDRGQWQQKKLDRIFWGGEPAGALLTKYLSPEKFTFYSDLPKTDVMKQLHLVPDTSGEVEWLKPFWNTEQAAKEFPLTVPPLLVYAELSASFDSRNRETAEKIKKRYHV